MFLWGEPGGVWAGPTWSGPEPSGSDKRWASPWRCPPQPQVRYMLTGRTGHSSPDAALSRQARQRALSFRTPPSHPIPYLECTTLLWRLNPQPPRATWWWDGRVHSLCSHQIPRKKIWMWETPFPFHGKTRSSSEKPLPPPDIVLGSQNRDSCVLP